MNQSLTWLEQHLVDEGHMTERRVTMKAKLRRCAHCRQLILAALDAPVCALEIHLEPYPTTAAGEAFALLTGRTTWHLLADRCIHNRCVAAIEHRSADVAPTIHAAHRCGAPASPVHPEYRPPGLLTRHAEPTF